MRLALLPSLRASARRRAEPSPADRARFLSVDSDAQVVMQNRDVILAPQSGGFMATLREPIQTAKDRNQILGKPRRDVVKRPRHRDIATVHGRDIVRLGRCCACERGCFSGLSGYAAHRTRSLQMSLR